MSNGSEELTVVVNSLADGSAVLATADGQKVVIKKRFLPKDAREGEILTVELLTTSQVTERRKHLAKAILGEILGTANEKTKKPTDSV